MGASIQASGGGGGRRGRSRADRPMDDINVTPMVDVMLVLLIVFMVTAPLLTVGVPVDLPKTQAGALNEKVEPLTISVKGQGLVVMQDTEVPFDDLISRLQAIVANKPDTTVFVRGDKDVTYGDMLQVMATITQGGFTHVALLAQQPTAAP